MAQKEIQVQIVVDIAKGNPHACFCYTNAIYSSSHHHGLILKSAISLIDPQKVRLPIICNINFGVVVAVQICSDYAQSLGGSSGDSGRDGDVGKCIVPIVPVEYIGNAGKACRSALLQPPGPIGTYPGGIIVDIVRYIDVEVTVEIIVK